MQRSIANVCRAWSASLNRYSRASTRAVSFNSRLFTNLQTQVEESQPRVRRKFHIDDLIIHIQLGKPFYLKQLTNVFHTIEFNSLPTEKAVLLLRFCGSAVADSSRQQRNNICQDIFNRLKDANNTNSSIINRYIKTCTENHVCLDINIFGGDLNVETYRLLLANVCESGRVEDAFKVLSIMKEKRMPLTTEDIKSLVLVYTLTGGIKAAEEVLDTMKIAKISESDELKSVLYKGLIRRGDLEEFTQVVEMYPVKFTEHEFLQIVEEMGVNDLESWLEKCQICYKHILFTRELQGDIEKICLHLIYMENVESSMNIYRKFVQPHPDVSYGFLLLKQMLHSNYDINVIINFAKDLKDEGLNQYILEHLTGLALKCNYVYQAWELLSKLNIVRAHYFWPLIVNAGKTKGEQGVFEVLDQVKVFKDVKLDFETFENYILPYSNLANPKYTVIRLKEANFTVREFFSPLISILIRKHQLKNAAELCNNYEVGLEGEQFLHNLAKCWAATKDTESARIVLARFCESNSVDHDLVGRFLVNAVNLSKLPNDLTYIIQLIETIGEQRLKIGSQSADALREIVTPKVPKHEQFDEILNGLVDIRLNFMEQHQFIHPRNMDVDGLECHLIELQEKNMETRGVLRKLIQTHARNGNRRRVDELRKQFLDSGYEESAGIISSIMHSYIMGGHLDESIVLYHNLRSLNPEFNLDSFKILDLAKLLVENDRFDEALDILKKESPKCKNSNYNSISRNVRELLNAGKNPEEAWILFELLRSSGLCKPTNVILGSIIRSHLKLDDINGAVKSYLKLSTLYRCTPYQTELLKVLSKREDSVHLDEVLKATQNVHGTVSAQGALVAALAENGQENALKNLLMNITEPIRTFINLRCNRWVETNSIEPLQCLAKVCHRLPQLDNKIDINFVHRSIIHIYDINCDYDGALHFINTLPEEFRTVSLESEITKLSNNKRASKS